MAESKGIDVFEKSPLSSISNPDELDRYVKVANPSAWVVLIAALLLVGGIIIWGIVAVVPVTVDTTGVVTEEYGVVCWVDEATAGKIEAGTAVARVGGVECGVARVYDLPMSSMEVLSYIGVDYAYDALNLKDWNYLVIIEPSDELEFTDFSVSSIAGDVHLVPVSITVEETSPIFIVYGGE